MKLYTKVSVLDSKIIIPVGREPVGTTTLFSPNPRGNCHSKRSFTTQRRNKCRLRKHRRCRACQTIKGPDRAESGDNERGLDRPLDDTTGDKPISGMVGTGMVAPGQRATGGSTAGLKTDGVEGWRISQDSSTTG